MVEHLLRYDQVDILQGRAGGKAGKLCGRSGEITSEL